MIEDQSPMPAKARAGTIATHSLQMAHCHAEAVRGLAGVEIGPIRMSAGMVPRSVTHSCSPPLPKFHWRR